jgi:hypothetical protein
LPPATRDALLADIRTAQTARTESVVESTRKTQAAQWAHWESFCDEQAIDCHLLGVQGAAIYLQAFLVRVRRGDLNRHHKPTRSGTVAKYLCAISKEIIRMVDEADRTTAIVPRSLHPSLRELLTSFAGKDPPTDRVWPVNATIVTELSCMSPPSGFTPNQWRRIQDMCVLGYFFLLRPGEYAETKSKDSKTVPFRLEHIHFLHENDTLIVHPSTVSCNDSTLHFGGLRFDDQKNSAKGDMVTHERTNKPICPVRALQRIAADIIRHHGSSQTPLFCYYEDTGRYSGGFLSLTADQLTAALRLAAARCEHITGIPPSKINVRSLRAGGATALLCAKIDKNVVKLLFRWRSDAIDKYLRTSTHTLTRGFSTKMLEHGNYKFISYGDVQDKDDYTSIPDLLPDDIDADTLREYYKLITANES